MKGSPHPLLDKEITFARKRVLMLAGSDLDFPFQAIGMGPARHRLIISDDASPEPWQKENLIGWDIRRISPEPRWRFTVSDDHALVTELDEAYSFKGMAVLEGRAVRPIVNYFEQLWRAGACYQPMPGEVPILIPKACSNIVTASEGNWSNLLKHLAHNPSDVRNLTPDEFERLIAELLRRDGMEVELTGMSRDGGRDILAWSNNSVGRPLCLVECKRYSPTRKVDVRMIRALYGVLESERATSGMLVTTSDFTQSARRFQEGVRNRVTLKNFGDVAKWIRRLSRPDVASL